MHLESKSPFSPTVGANWLRFETFRWPEYNGWFYGVIKDDEDKGHAVKVRQSPDGIEFHGDAPEKAVRRYFRLDEDITEVHEALSRQDQTMKWLVERYGDMRILRQDPWECLVSFICAQGVSVERTTRIVNRLAERHSERHKDCHSSLSLDGVTLHVFPSACCMAKMGKVVLMDLGLLGRSQRLILKVARDIAEEGRDLNALAALPYKEAKGQLLEWYRGKGIGEKTADCVCLFALGQGESFPIDTHIQSALGNLYGKGKGRKWAQDYFGPNAGYASQLLFLSDIL